MFVQGQVIPAAGCITKEVYLLGKSLPEIERILGYGPGRLAAGCAIGAAMRIPQTQELVLAGYNQVATDKIDRNTFGKGLDEDMLKRNVVAQMTTIGANRLVKCFPITPHGPESIYPPGMGIPQWIIKRESPLQFQIVAIIPAGGVYRSPYVNA